MRLLLDTHVVLWWALGDPRLSALGRALIADTDNEVAVSVASLWEVAIRSQLHRPARIEVGAVRYAALIDEAGFPLLPITRDQALAVERLDFLHGDPFDRLLVAIAQLESMLLVTRDQRLADVAGEVILV